MESSHCFSPESVHKTIPTNKIRVFCVQTQSPVYNQQYSGKGVAPTFVKVI